MIRHRIVAITALACVLSVPVVRGDATRDKAEIEQLLQQVERSRCHFVRNGSSHAGPESAAHLRNKWRLADRRNLAGMTAEQFIAGVASTSTMTGQPYLIDCGSGPQPLSAWLLGGLKRLRDHGDPP